MMIPSRHSSNVLEILRHHPPIPVDDKFYDLERSFIGESASKHKLRIYLTSCLKRR